MEAAASSITRVVQNNTGAAARANKPGDNDSSIQIEKEVIHPGSIITSNVPKRTQVIQIGSDKTPNTDRASKDSQKDKCATEKNDSNSESFGKASKEKAAGEKSESASGSSEKASKNCTKNKSEGEKNELAPATSEKVSKDSNTDKAEGKRGDINAKQTSTRRISGGDKSSNQPTTEVSESVSKVASDSGSTKTADTSEKEDVAPRVLVVADEESNQSTGEDVVLDVPTVYVVDPNILQCAPSSSMQDQDSPALQQLEGRKTRGRAVKIHPP